MSDEKFLSQEAISLLVETFDLKDFKVSIKKNVGEHGNLGEIVFVSLISETINKKFDLVIKQALSTDTKESVEAMQHLYIHEIYFYHDIWSEMEKFQNEFQGVTSHLIPKYYAVCRVSGKEILVLENLKLSGFKVLPKDVVFDDNHFELALRAYGKFHGISAAFREHNPREYGKLTNQSEKCINTVFQEDFFQVLMDAYLQNTRDMISDEKIKVKMSKYVTNYKDMLTNSIKYNGRNSVIVHGDCWSSNLMFKYDNYGIPTDVRLLDFQMYFSGSVVLDISYLLYSGGTKDNYKNFDNYLKIYYNSFSETLRSFKLDPSGIFTFADLKNEWKDHCAFGFLMAQLLWGNKLAKAKTDIVRILEELKIGKSRGISTIEQILDAFQIDRVKRAEYCVDMAEHLYEKGYL